MKPSQPNSSRRTGGEPRKPPQNSTDRLYTLLRSNNGPKPILFLGAGASVKSGIPTSDQLVERAAKWAYCEAHGLHQDDPSVVRSDWLRWLHGHGWYRQDSAPSDNYSIVVEHLLQPRQARKDFFLRVIKPGVPASAGYHRLLRLVDDGFIDTILTTNFDNVFLELCASKNRPHHIDVVRTPADYTMLSTSPRYPQYVFLHGTVEHYTDRNMIAEVQQLDSPIVERLTPLLRDRPIVVVGYRGAEPSIMRHLFLNTVSATERFRQGLFWCVRHSDTSRPHPLVEELRAAIGTNFQLISVDGFDEVLEQLAVRCGAQHTKTLSGRVALNRDPKDGLPFDMSPVEAPLDEIDWARVQTVLVTYCKAMSIPLPKRIEHAWIVERMGELDLATKNGTTVSLTAAGYLLFAKSPDVRISGATTSVRMDGKAEVQFTGNLWSQLDALIDLADQINRPFRLKDTVSEEVFPYPKLALKELIVNALVHRTYERPEPLIVDIDGAFLRITNPGGLVDAVFAKVDGNLQQHIEDGARGIKGYRNPVIADLFYGAGAMDKEGSGLPDVQTQVRQNGGQVTYGPTHENQSFRAVIYRRPESADAQTRTATSTVQRTKYSSNLLEVVSHPDVLWTGIATAKKVGDVVDQLPSPYGWPFVWKRGEIITFSDLTDPQNPLARFIKKGSVRDHRWSKWETDKDRSRELVWLLNECLYKMLYRRLMVVDRFRKRAYFPRTDKGPREITYRASFRQATRTVTKAVISKKTQRVVYWEHEAFWFGFEVFADAWALRILPGYVFTTDGDRALLYHKRVGALATKKAARDYNQQVLNDLVFWAWIFSEGKDKISLPTSGPSNIELFGSLASCELAMPVGTDEDLSHEYTELADEELEEIEREIADEAERDLQEANSDADAN